VACPAMTQNDHNLLLGLNVSQVAYVIKDQIKEVLKINGKSRDDKKVDLGWADPTKSSLPIVNSRTELKN
jgi:hypothetical protein